MWSSTACSIVDFRRRQPSCSFSSRTESPVELASRVKAGNDSIVAEGKLVRHCALRKGPLPARLQRKRDTRDGSRRSNDRSHDNLAGAAARAACRTRGADVARGRLARTGGRRGGRGGVRAGDVRRCRVVGDEDDVGALEESPVAAVELDSARGSVSVEGQRARGRHALNRRDRAVLETVHAERGDVDVEAELRRHAGSIKLSDGPLEATHLSSALNRAKLLKQAVRLAAARLVERAKVLRVLVERDEDGDGGRRVVRVDQEGCRAGEGVRGA